MIHYYTNREISNLLGINLSKWKRWSRSFLPPDPLGGLQSGYARQYTFKDLFKVFFGGHLLGHLKLSVVESRQVIEDVSPWLRKEGFLKPGGPNWALVGTGGTSERYQIYFSPQPTPKGKMRPAFRYLFQKTAVIDNNETSDSQPVVRTYRQTVLQGVPSKKGFEDLMDDPFAYFINLTALYAKLAAELQQ